ncbi:hypothetical protein Tco_0286011 [Tanacetum coccineum]
MQEVILFYNRLNVPIRHILDSKGAIPTKTAVDAKIAIIEMAKYSQKWHNGTSSKARSTETSNGLAAIQAQLNNLRREINKVNKNVYATQAQDNQGHEERMDDPTLEPSVCKIRRFEMMKYSFNDDEEYIAIKESKYLNHSKDNLDAYRELLRIINEGWIVATPDEE